MAFPLGIGEAGFEHARRYRPGSIRGGLSRGGDDGRQVEICLLAAEKLDVDLRHDLGVEERPVLGAPAAIDPVVVAESVEVITVTRVHAPGEEGRVDHVIQLDCRWPPLKQARILGVEEADVEGRVVDDQRSVADKGQQLGNDGGEQRLLGSFGF